MGRLLRRVLLLVAALTALALAGLLFASTEAGFRLLLRPLLADRGLEVARGRVDLGGSVEADEIRWSSGSAEALRLSFDPLSLLPGRRPHVHSLEVVALSADLPPGDDGDAATESAPFAIPGLEVTRATVSLARLRQLDSNGEVVWQLGPAELSLEQWRPGHDQGRLEARADFALPGSVPPRSGTLEISAQLRVPETDSEPHGFAQALLVASLAPDDLALRAQPEGSVGERIELSAPLELSRGGAPLLEDASFELALDDASTDLALRAGRVALPTLLAALGRPEPSPAVAALELGLEARVRRVAETPGIEIESFELEQRRPGAEPVRVALHGRVVPGPAPSLELDIEGPGADGGVGAARVALQGGELDLKVVSLDLTSLLEPWLEDGGEAESGAKVPAVAQADDAAPETSRTSLLARIEVGVLRFRELRVHDARATWKREGPALSLDLPAAGLGEGSLSGRFESDTAEGRRTLAWKLDAEQLDLGEVFRSLAPDDEGKLAGKLDLASEVSSSVPADADPLDALEGGIRFALRDAEAQGLPFQQFMASKLAVDGLASLAFTGAEGDIPIRAGRAILDELYLDGNAANFKMSGELSARDIDLSVNPRLGPRLASGLKPRFGKALFETASGALALPVAFRVQGPWGDTRFLMLPAPPSLMGDVVGGTADALKNAGRLLLGEGDGSSSEDASPPTTEPPAPSEPDTE